MEKRERSLTLATEKREWSDIPQDLLRLIFCGLCSDRDRCAFKSVCKSWNSITSVHDPQFYVSPCLMIPKKKTTDTWEIFHSVYHDFHYLDFPELMDAQVRFSNSGWLLLSRGTELFFFDPFMEWKIEIPPSPFPFISVCFTSAPNIIGGCLLFGIYSTSTSSSTDFGLLCVTKGPDHWYDGLSDDCWYDLSYENSRDLSPSSCPPVFSNGVFYCLDKFGDVFTFDVASKAMKHHVNSFKPRHEIQQCYMVRVGGGEIWGIFVDIKECLLMKLDLEEMDWVPMKDLGNKCLYVGANGSFAKNDRGLANTIYFDRFYHSVDGDFVVTDPCSLKIQTDSNATWIQPNRDIKPLVFNSSTTSDWLDWI